MDVTLAVVMVICTLITALATGHVLTDPDRLNAKVRLKEIELTKLNVEKEMLEVRNNHEIKLLE